jgi:molybdopterin-binding protein
MARRISFQAFLRWGGGAALPQWLPPNRKRKSIMSIQSVNARNQFKGKVKEIILGTVVSEVDVETPYGVVTSVITTRSVKDLQLEVGTEVVALVKATEVSIAKL